jgi:hypothetical protein
MSVLRMRNYMLGTLIHKCRCLKSCFCSSLLLVRNLLIFESGLYVFWMLVFLNIFISVLTCGPPLLNALFNFPV